MKFVIFGIGAPLLLALAPVAPATAAAAAPAARHYDCSKAGNANKTVCKDAAAAAARPARHYDCSKAGNANKAVCKGAMASRAPQTPPAPQSRVVHTATAHSEIHGQVTQAPAGAATAKCRDGSLSYSRTHRGTCSHHGGVASWLGG